MMMEKVNDIFSDTLHVLWCILYWGVYSTRVLYDPHFVVRALHISVINLNLRSDLLCG